MASTSSDIGAQNVNIAISDCQPLSQLPATVFFELGVLENP